MTKFVIILLFIKSIIFSQNWVTQLNKKYSPAVVVIENQQYGEIKSFGTGFNISENGLIVTNYHVVEEAEKIIVRFKNGDEYDGHYYTYVDKDKDFVIIKIPGYELPTVELGNSNKVEIGNEVIAIGNPLGAWHSVTKGIISQNIDYGSFRMFQTDVFIAPGSSGGPLFNNKKEIIGVTTSGISPGLDINYAIPINYVQGAINSSSPSTKKNIGFDHDKRLDEFISIVKSLSYNNISINDALKNKNPKWKAFIADGFGYVNVNFNLTRNKEPVDVVWQFKIYGDNQVKYNAVAIDGIEEGNETHSQIISLLFKDDSNENKVDGNSTTTKKTTNKVVKTNSNEEPSFTETVLGCYCMYLIILGLMPRG